MTRPELTKWVDEHGEATRVAMDKALADDYDLNEEDEKLIFQLSRLMAVLQDTCPLRLSLPLNAIQRVYNEKQHELLLKLKEEHQS